jgi:hypothetical protein
VTRAAWAASLLLTVGVGGVAAEPDRDAGAEAPDAGSETPRGEFDSNDPTTWDLPPAVPRPDFMRNRSFIPDELLREKREGRYFTAIPAIGWDAEEGFNLGAFVEFFDNGSREDPFFRTRTSEAAPIDCESGACSSTTRSATTSASAKTASRTSTIRDRRRASGPTKTSWTPSTG